MASGGELLVICRTSPTLSQKRVEVPYYQKMFVFEDEGHANMMSFRQKRDGTTACLLQPLSCAQPPSSNTAVWKLAEQRCVLVNQR